METKCRQTSRCGRPRRHTRRSTNPSILQSILSNDPNPSSGAVAVPPCNAVSSPYIQNFTISPPMSYPSGHYSSFNVVPCPDGSASFVQELSSVQPEAQPPSLSVNWYDMPTSSASMPRPATMTNNPSQILILDPSSLLPLQCFCTNFPFPANPPQISTKRLFDMASSMVFNMGDVQRQLCQAINGFVE